MWYYQLRKTKGFLELKGIRNVYIDTRHHQLTNICFIGATEKSKVLKGGKRLFKEKIPSLNLWGQKSPN